MKCGVPVARTRGRRATSTRATRYASYGGVSGTILALFLGGWPLLSVRRGVPLHSAMYGYGLVAAATSLPVWVVTALLYPGRTGP